MEKSILNFHFEPLPNVACEDPHRQGRVRGRWLEEYLLECSGTDRTAPEAKDDTVHDSDI